MNNEDNGKRTYVFTFTYRDNSGETVEIEKTDLNLLGLVKETTNLDYFNKNWELMNLMAQYWDKDGKPSIRELLPNGNLSEPIEHPSIDKITKMLTEIKGSMSNATKRDLESEILARRPYP